MREKTDMEQTHSTIFLYFLTFRIFFYISADLLRQLMKLQIDAGLFINLYCTYNFNSVSFFPLRQLSFGSDCVPYKI